MKLSIRVGRNIGIVIVCFCFIAGVLGATSGKWLIAVFNWVLAVVNGFCALFWHRAYKRRLEIEKMSKVIEE